MKYDPDQIIDDLWSRFEPDRPGAEYQLYVLEFIVTYLLMNPSIMMTIHRLCLLELDGWDIFSNYPEVSPSCSKEEMISSLRRVDMSVDRSWNCFAEALTQPKP